jgi:hypothetical protein
MNKDNIRRFAVMLAEVNRSSGKERVWATVRLRHALNMYNMYGERIILHNGWAYSPTLGMIVMMKSEYAISEEGRVDV